MLLQVGVGRRVRPGLRQLALRGAVFGQDGVRHARHLLRQQTQPALALLAARLELLLIDRPGLGQAGLRQLQSMIWSRSSSCVPRAMYSMLIFVRSARFFSQEPDLLAQGQPEQPQQAGTMVAARLVGSSNVEIAMRAPIDQRRVAR